MGVMSFDSFFDEAGTNDAAFDENEIIDQVAEYDD